MRLSAIGIGLFFLLNPVLGVSDVIPDFIGCFLIMLGIRDASYMIEKLAFAKRWFGYGAVVSLLRFAVGFTDVDKLHTMPLTLAFAFAVAETIIYIPAIKALFEGFDYAAMRHGGSGVLSIGKRRGIYTDESGTRQYGEIQDDTTGRLASSLIVFTVIRGVMSLLPELPALQLTESENVGDVTGFQFSSIANLIRFFVIVAVLIPAVITFVKYVRFLVRIHRAGDFIPALQDELVRRFGDLSEMHTASRMKLCSIGAGAALLLYMGFYDYQMNLIPRYVPAVILAAVAVVLAVSADKKLVYLLPVVPAAATVPLAVKTVFLQKEHYGFYKQIMADMLQAEVSFAPDRDINRIDAEYLQMAFFESGEALVLGAGIVLCLALYLRLAVRHTRQFTAVAERNRLPLERSLKIRGGLMIGGAALSAVYFTAYRFILPFFDAAPVVGIAVNILAVALFAAFAVEANQSLYGNGYEV